MRTIALPLLSTLLVLFQSRALLHLEILALRQQLAMVNQAPPKRLRFDCGQRLFWVCLYRLWPGCLQTLQVFKPDTVVRWHRKGFRLYWTWKSRCRRGGRPPVSPEVRKLIRTMSQDNIGEHKIPGAKFKQITPQSSFQTPLVPLMPPQFSS